VTKVGVNRCTTFERWRPYKSLGGRGTLVKGNTEVWGGQSKGIKGFPSCRGKEHFLANLEAMEVVLREERDLDRHI